MGNSELFTKSGPLLSDETFFAAVIDPSEEGMAEVSKAAEKGDYQKAKSLFANHVRMALQPRRYFQISNSSVSRGFLKHEQECIKDAAERVLRLELVSSGTSHSFMGEVDWFTNPTENQYREWTWQLNRHMDFKILARRYLDTGDERYAEGFVKLFRSWVRQAVAPKPGTSAYKTYSWRTIEAGIRMLDSWPYALHAFYKSPYFTDDILIDWYKSVWEHGNRLRNNYQIGNWLIMEMNGLAHIGLLYPQFRDAKEWRNFAINKLKDELTVQIYPDGFQFELSTGYHQIVTQYRMVADVYQVYGQSVPLAFMDTLEKAYAVNRKMMMPDGRLPNVNDGAWLDIAKSMQAALKSFPHRDDFLWAATRGKEGRPPVETSVALPYAGYYVMRSGWDQDAVWAMLDAGPFGRAHQHEDKLNLLIHAYGKMLLTEGGNYAYDDSEMRRYVLSTRSHNTIRVDGMDQNRKSKYKWKAEDIYKKADAQWFTSDKLDRVEGNYDEGYGDNAETQVKHSRKVLFIKEAPGLAPFFVVIDRLYPQDNKPHRYEILWHFDSTGVTVDGLNVTAEADNGAKLAVLPAEAAHMNLEIIQGQEIPEWQGWKATAQGMQGQYAAIPTAVYTVTVEEPVPIRQATLLYPVKPDGVCPVVEVKADANANSTSVELRLADGEWLRLDEKL